MLDIVKQNTALPTKPTASDTADWYRLGDAVEKHGRHMKRQAVAAEHNSGRNMAEWARFIDQPYESVRQMVKESKTLGLLPDETGVVTPEISEALPTQMAAREYAKAEPEIREVIKEIIKEDPDAEIKAAEIKRLRAELKAAKETNPASFVEGEFVEVVDFEKKMATEKVHGFGYVVGDFMENLNTYFLMDRQYASQEIRERHDVRLRELAAVLERHMNPIATFTPTTIDI